MKVSDLQDGEALRCVAVGSDLSAALLLPFARSPAETIAMTPAASAKTKLLFSRRTFSYDPTHAVFS
jgi:hypothetical protein